MRHQAVKGEGVLRGSVVKCRARIPDAPGLSPIGSCGRKLLLGLSRLDRMN